MKRFTREERQARKKQINELNERFYRGKTDCAGEPVKYDATPAGIQGNMFDIQAQSPKGAITSGIPLSRQIEGTMFGSTRPEEPTLFGGKEHD